MNHKRIGLYAFCKKNHLPKNINIALFPPTFFPLFAAINYHRVFSEMPISCDNNNAALDDAERRKRIESSPVKLFYKTVPLDEAGKTIP